MVMRSRWTTSLAWWRDTTVEAIQTDASGSRPTMWLPSVSTTVRSSLVSRTIAAREAGLPAGGMYRRVLGVITDPLDVLDEAVAPAGEGLHEARALGGIAQRDPDLGDRVVHGLIEGDRRRGGPEPAAELVARDEIARVLDEGREELKRLLLQANARTAPAQFTRPRVEIERPEAGDAAGRLARAHAAPFATGLGSQEEASSARGFCGN